MKLEIKIPALKAVGRHRNLEISTGMEDWWERDREFEIRVPALKAGGRDIELNI